MLTLYYAPGACSLAAHVVLEWIGEPYEAIRVDQHAPDFRAVNPAGAVPALRMEDGGILTQCDAVLHYLGRRHPEADLLDERSAETAAELDRWGCFLTGDLHPAFFPVFVPDRYTVATDEASLDAVRRAGLVLVTRKLELFDAHLQDREWIAGGKRTIVDAYAIPMLNWARAKLPDGLVPFPAVEAHHRRMLADPAVQRVVAEERSAA